MIPITMERYPGPPRVFFDRGSYGKPQEIRHQAMAEGDVERERMRMAKTQDRMATNGGKQRVVPKLAWLK